MPGHYTVVEGIARDLSALSIGAD